MAYVLAPLLLLLVVPIVIHADPDPLQDFCVSDTTSSTIFMNGFPCLKPNETASTHFTTSNLSRPGNTSGSPFGASVTFTSPQVLAGINTLGISMARVDVAVGGTVLPLIHPRASRIIFVLQGTLIVGFVDTTNKLFSADIKTGDVFVTPRGLIHLAQNIGNTPSYLIEAFNSQSLSTSFVSLATFASNPAIPSQVLAKSFQTSVAEVDKIRMNLGDS